MWQQPASLEIIQLFFTVWNMRSAICVVLLVGERSGTDSITDKSGIGR